MAVNMNANKIELPDEDQVIETDSLSDIISSWDSEVSSIDIGSINIMGEFAPLVDNGVAASFFDELNDSIRALSECCTSLSGSITFLINEQTSVDTNGRKQTQNITSYANVSGEHADDIAPEEYEETEDIKIDEELINEFNDCIVNFDEYQHVSLITTLQKFCNNDLNDLLYDENYNSIKKLLSELKNMKTIPDNLKNVLLKLEPQQAQVILRELITNGNVITDFSKYIFTSYFKTEKINGVLLPASAKNLSTDILKTYREISYSNIQRDLKKIYDGETDASSDTVSFTKDFIDSIATSQNISSKELLSNPDYAEGLKTCTSDLIKTSSYLNASCNIGDDAANTILSNIIVKEA